MRPAITIALSAFLAFVLVACGGPDTEPPESTPTTMATATAAYAPATLMPATPSAAPTEKPAASSTVDVSSKTPDTGPGGTPPPSAPPQPGIDLFKKILGPTSAPPGWSLRTCWGDNAFLCVYAGEEITGAIELSMYPIETLPEFKGMLSDAGLSPDAVDYKDPNRRPS